MIVDYEMWGAEPDMEMPRLAAERLKELGAYSTGQESRTQLIASAVLDVIRDNPTLLTDKMTALTEEIGDLMILDLLTEGETAYLLINLSRKDLKEAKTLEELAVMLASSMVDIATHVGAIGV